ncbi:hypothetical protein SAMN05421835_1408 [Amycolatopsis sacchari]|uniref:Uncharacterized protein n=1 Tax=Amycolatopsis sacchari TaxID=115433 RepID=A0A1I4D1D8_9PSEU|nr:hypothetical protein SAMN05421835_1408 [Amycolatopsis sacchari]
MRCGGALTSSVFGVRLLQRGQLLVLSERAVSRSMVADVVNQVGHPALIQFRQSPQHLERGRVPGFGGPELPVGEVLERLRVGRPTFVPSIGGVALTPAPHQPQRRAHVDVVAMGEHLGDLHPGLGFSPQFTGRLRLLRTMAPDLAGVADAPLASGAPYSPRARAGGRPHRSRREGTGCSGHASSAPQPNQPAARLVLAEPRPRTRRWPGIWPPAWSPVTWPRTRRCRQNVGWRRNTAFRWVQPVTPLGSCAFVA